MFCRKSRSPERRKSKEGDSGRRRSRSRSPVRKSSDRRRSRFVFYIISILLRQFACYTILNKRPKLNTEPGCIYAIHNHKCYYSNAHGALIICFKCSVKHLLWRVYNWLGASVSSNWCYSNNSRDRVNHIFWSFEICYHWRDLIERIGNSNINLSEFSAECTALNQLLIPTRSTGNFYIL